MQKSIEMHLPQYEIPQLSPHYYGCIINDDEYPHGTILHEFIHAWGYFHEHVRPDRDNYVKVHMQNVKSDMRENFRKQKDSCTYGVPYDGNSIMHYPSRAFIVPYLPPEAMTIESLVSFDHDFFYLST